MGVGDRRTLEKYLTNECFGGRVGVLRNCDPAAFFEASLGESADNEKSPRTQGLSHDPEVIFDLFRGREKMECGPIVPELVDAFGNKLRNIRRNEMNGARAISKSRPT